MMTRAISGRFELLSPHALAQWLEQRHPESYLLLDVRQRHEYAAAHLPGARHMPLTELIRLRWRCERALPVVVCCRYGWRGAVVARLLVAAGFPRVFVLDGGMESWDGVRACGLPESFLGEHCRGSDPAGFLAAAWHMEDGAQQLYSHLATHCHEPHVARLFARLVRAEQRHKQTLASLGEVLSQHDQVASLASLAGEAQLAEGGVPLEDLLAAVQDREPREQLDVAVALEVDALDRYLWFGREVGDENVRRVLEVIADEERHHLRQLLKLYDELNLDENNKGG